MSSVDHVVTLAKPLQCLAGMKYPAGQIVIARQVDSERVRCVTLSGAFAGKSAIARMDDMVCESPFSTELVTEAA